MSFLEVAPFLDVRAVVEDGVLRVGPGSGSEWFVKALEYDLADSSGLRPPWLPRVRSKRTSADFALPPRGVTLGALWPTLQTEQQAGVMLSLLKTMLRAGPLSMFPRSGVLCGSDGSMWLVPPFKMLVDGAAKTWDDFQFDEYCIGGMSGELTQGLALTLQRLLVRLPLNEVFLMRRLTPHPPSLTVEWLRPLDALVAQANDELLNKRAPAPGAAARWASTIAVLDDQYQQSSRVSLGELVERAWPTTHETLRWA